MIRTAPFPTAIAAIGLALGVAAGAAAQDKPSIPGVEFISGSPTGSWFPVASVVAEMTNENYDGQPISVIPGAGGVGNPLRVGTGQSDIGISYGPFLKLAQEGGNDLYSEAFPQLRAIGGMTANTLHIIAAEDMDFAEIAKEQPALRVGTGPTGSTELFMLGEVFEAYGFGFEDVEAWGGRVERLETSQRGDGFQNRHLDLINFFINPPAAAVTTVMASREGSRILTLDADVAAGLIEEWGLLEIVIPAGTYPNQDEDVISVGMPYVYFTTEDLDPDVVYNMTKAIAENHERLQNTHAAFEKWRPEDMHKGLGIELHEGARRYYQDRGWL